MLQQILSCVVDAANFLSIGLQIITGLWRTLD